MVQIAPTARTMAEASAFDEPRASILPEDSHGP
jgi:hypothetical protein